MALCSALDKAGVKVQVEQFQFLVCLEEHKVVVGPEQFQALLMVCLGWRKTQALVEHQAVAALCLGRRNIAVACLGQPHIVLAAYLGLRPAAPLLDRSLLVVVCLGQLKAAAACLGPCQALPEVCLGLTAAVVVCLGPHRAAAAAAVGCLGPRVRKAVAVACSAQCPALVGCLVQCPALVVCLGRQVQVGVCLGLQPHRAAALAFLGQWPAPVVLCLGRPARVVAVCLAPRRALVLVVACLACSERQLRSQALRTKLEFPTPQPLQVSPPSSQTRASALALGSSASSGVPAENDPGDLMQVLVLMLSHHSRCQTPRS